MASIRNSIHSALCTMLGGIKATDGYTNTVVTVVRRLLTQEEVTGTPTLMCLAGPTSRQVADNGQGLWKATMPFIIVGFLRCDVDPLNEEETLADAADALIEDIENCLLADTSLTVGPTALAHNMTIDSLPPYVDTTEGWTEVQVLVTVTWYHESTT